MNMHTYLLMWNAKMYVVLFEAVVCRPGGLPAPPL